MRRDWERFKQWHGRQPEWLRFTIDILATLAFAALIGLSPYIAIAVLTVLGRNH